MLARRDRKVYELASCAALQDGAELLGEATVGGRPVSVFRLREPLDVGAHRTRLWSCRRQKSSAYATGWEHAEVACSGPTKGWRRRGAAARHVVPKGALAELDPRVEPRGPVTPPR